MLVFCIHMAEDIVKQEVLGSGSIRVGSDDLE